jgi:addiction module RelE/StbE family toxin
MDIFFTDRFKNRFNKLPKDIQDKFQGRLDLFLSNPRSASIKNHPLKGYLAGKRAFSVTGNYRAIYKILRENAILLVDI